MKEWFQSLFSNPSILPFIRAGFIALTGIALLIGVHHLTSRFLKSRFDPHLVMLIRKIVSYLILFVVLIWVLNELGFSLSVLLGATGILTVAIGFASQRSVSNIISGFFLIAERPFIVGDMIEIEGTTGVVDAIDLLSIKVTTPDNLYVCIPNETALKSKVTNLTRFPLRRLDLKMGIAYQQDLSQVKKILDQVASENSHCLKYPEPLFICLRFNDSWIDIQYSVWGKKENFLELSNSMFFQIKEVFQKNNIQFPFPHRQILTEKN